MHHGCTFWISLFLLQLLLCLHSVNMVSVDSALVIFSFATPLPPFNVFNMICAFSKSSWSKFLSILCCTRSIRSTWGGASFLLQCPFCCYITLANSLQSWESTATLENVSLQWNLCQFYHHYKINNEFFLITHRALIWPKCGCWEVFLYLSRWMHSLGKIISNDDITRRYSTFCHCKEYFLLATIW